MPRLDRLPQLNRNNLLMLPVQVNEGAPYTRPARPLWEQTYRVVPSDTPAAEIVQSHTSLGYDRVAIMRDLNISFPIDRLRELVAGGELAGWDPTTTRSWAPSARSCASKATSR